MKILKRYPTTRRSRPMAIAEMDGRYLEFRYLFLTEEDRAVLAHLSVADARPYVTVAVGSGLVCRTGVRCMVTGKSPSGPLPRTIDLPLDGDPDGTFDRFLDALEAHLAEAVL